MHNFRYRMLIDLKPLCTQKAPKDTKIITFLQNVPEPRSVTILGNDQMDEVKAKLDSVHKLLKKQVSFVDDAEAVEGRAEEEEVNYIGGAGFQGNQGGNRNSYGNMIESFGQRKKVIAV
ncbi:hypothetical protein F2Q70_00023261 [Brassica cretica]|uniref:Uncharacterized protein n=1 Tax=Brassica cretica TaxID=69181 RepID=A0A8S9GWR9_BRACR|nr:hypothetical protein F2Q70_00023261 [Brassica cretica]